MDEQGAAGPGVVEGVNGNYVFVPEGQSPGGEDFHHYIPEAERENEYWASIPDLATLVKNHANARELIGRKGVILPQENDPPEKVAEFYKALGRPDSPEGYALELPQEFPPEMVSPELLKGFGNWAHEAGLNPGQAKGIFGKYLKAAGEFFAKQNQAIETARVKTEKDLRTEWGDQYEANLDRANGVIRQFGDQFVKESLARKDPVWNDPALIRFLAKIGQGMAEHGLYGRDDAAAQNLEARLKEIQMNPVYWDKKHAGTPEHQALVKEASELYAKLHPNQAAE